MWMQRFVFHIVSLHITKVFLKTICEYENGDDKMCVSKKNWHKLYTCVSNIPIPRFQLYTNIYNIIQKNWENTFKSLNTSKSEI